MQQSLTAVDVISQKVYILYNFHGNYYSQERNARKTILTNCETFYLVKMLLQSDKRI